MATTLLGFSGSLRAGSFNTALLKAFAEQLPEGVSFELADIGHLPLFNQDSESPLPEAVVELKAKIRAADGILVSTPEYNRSIPGALKNAIDWTSRPDGDAAWEGAAVFVMGASTGERGAALAQYDLKRVMTYFGARLLGQPEFYCGNAKSKFDEAGKLTDEKTKEYIKKAIAAFLAFIGRR